MKLSGVFSCANSPAFSRDAEQFICTARYTFAVLGPEWVALRKQNRESIIAPPNVVRHRLLEALQREPVPRIVVIMAPAGYGKTTLALQWAEFTATKSAFLSLTNEHNTPDRFLQGLMRAIGLEPPGSPSLDTALDAIDQFAKGLSRSVLIIDDYHVIENQEIHQLMSILISRLPAGLQLVMSSRTAPEIPLARLRMNGQVRHITLSELSFSEDEIAELVTSSSVPFVSQDDIRELATRTAGWIAGIRLAMASTNANAMRPSRTASIIDSWSTQQALDEFVLEEVLSSLSDVLREFIFRTAFLPNLNADLCNHVLEIDNSAALLDEAIREVAFIRPASGGSSELAYHRLFAECANRIAERHYPLADRTARYLRAAAWFESQGKWEEAFEQALQAEEWEAVVRYTRRICGDLRQRDMSASRLHWLRKVPLQHILSHGDLTRWLVSALLETGHVTEANGILKQVMPAWAESGDPQLLAYMHMTSTFTSILQGNDGEALRSIYTALHYQTMDNHLERLHIWASIMLLEFHRGNDEIADEAYVQLQLCRQHLPAEQGWIFTHVEMAKTDQFARRGHLSTAIDRYQDQVDRQPAIFSHAIPNLQSRMAALYLEQNNLDMALEMARNIERGLELYPQQLWHTEAWLVVARVYAALGDRDRAREAINQARAIQETGGGWTLWLKIMATESWVNLSDPGSPKTSTTNIAVDNDKPFRTAFFGELDPRFVKVVQQITEGDLAQAAPLLESLLTGAIKTKRWAEIVQLAVWQVVIRLKSGDDAGALDALNLALRYGRPGGFVRSFVTPGYDLSAFMRDSLSLLDPENARYVQHLLQHDLWATSQPPIEEAVMSKGMSPLSSREHDVLTFLATGVSNKSISEKLFITERTVKKHVSNILQKLKVPNRTAAVARARELGIIT